MSLDILRLMTDFGLVVLIWLVQLIIYPGFAFYEMSHFPGWHRRYMQLVTFVVAPLMLLQAGLTMSQLFSRGSWTDWVSLLLVLLVWGITFFLAVPLHNALGETDGHKERVARLVAVNWYRTGTWSILWLISVYQVIGGLF